MKIYLILLLAFFSANGFAGISTSDSGGGGGSSGTANSPTAGTTTNSSVTGTTTTAASSVVNSVKLTGNSTVQINLSFTTSTGNCFSLTNSSAKVYFIPYKSLAEWNAFSAHKPSAITISACTILGQDGLCGAANGNQYDTAASVTSDGLCSGGTASPLSGTGPWTWSCDGQNGGANASCSAQLGSCYWGSVQGNKGTGLYSNATPESIDKRFFSKTACESAAAAGSCQPGPCQKSLPADGICGGANGKLYDTSASVNSAGLCSGGTASALGGSGPWTWSCLGQNGGTDASCNAQLASCYAGVKNINVGTSLGMDDIGKIYQSKAACEAATTFSCAPTPCKTTRGCVFGHPMSWNGHYTIAGNASTNGNITCMEYVHTNGTPFTYTTLQEGQCQTINANACYGSSNCTGSEQACCVSGVVNPCNPNADPSCTAGPGSMTYTNQTCSAGGYL